MRHVLTLGTLLAALAVTPVLAGANDELRPAREGECRIAAIPAHTITTERTVTVPPVRCPKRVPQYETVTVPVHETRRVPIHDTVEKPVYETVEVPVYRTERVPVWGEKEVTVYREERKPVTIEVWNPFECKDEKIELWDECERVPCGTKTVRAIVDHETRQVPCGTRLERRQVGTREEQVVVGHREERVQVGEREERRLTGWTTEQVVVEPASERTILEHTDVPCERVTVIPDGTSRDEPMAGTTRVLTESEYEAALAAAR